MVKTPHFQCRRYKFKPSWETKIPHAVRHSKKKKKKKPTTTWNTVVWEVRQRHRKRGVKVQKVQRQGFYSLALEICWG